MRGIPSLDLNEFSKGDQVMMKGRDKWQPATVLSKSATQLYVIKTLRGQFKFIEGMDIT